MVSGSGLRVLSLGFGLIYEDGLWFRVQDFWFSVSVLSVVISPLGFGLIIFLKEFRTRGLGSGFRSDKLSALGLGV